MPGRLAVIGAGWAGIAAAVAATSAGHSVSLFEMAPSLGGRARRIDLGNGLAVDNGQHILIGAYTATLDLMRQVGANPDSLLHRLPLALVDPSGEGLTFPPGSPAQAFVRAVFSRKGWTVAERIGLLRTALGWRISGFEARPSQSVADITCQLSARVRQSLIEPLCVAALNTPAQQASATVFLRVLKDALFGDPGSADMLLPRVPLSSLLPDPAERWLTGSGAKIRRQTRVQTLCANGTGWDIDGESFDAAVLACSASEAARLVANIAPAWSATAAALEYEPIVTVYVRSNGTRLAVPMTALATGAEAPAQFVFDLGAIDGGGPREGVFAFVVSGARGWVDRGLESTGQATLKQAASAFGVATWREPPTLLRTVAEKRATFLCVPGMARPPGRVVKGLAAAGDFVDGPYPATLEGAVRSGNAAIVALDGSRGVPSQYPDSDFAMR